MYTTKVAERNTWSKRGYFRVAHKLTKQIRREGDSYRVTFGACLKYARSVKKVDYSGFEAVKSAVLVGMKEAGIVDAFISCLTGMVDLIHTHKSTVTMKLGRFIKKYAPESHDETVKALVTQNEELSRYYVRVSTGGEGYITEAYSDAGIKSCMSGENSVKHYENTKFGLVEVFEEDTGKRVSRTLFNVEKKAYCKPYCIREYEKVIGISYKVLDSLGLRKTAKAFIGLKFDKVDSFIHLDGHAKIADGVTVYKHSHEWAWLED